MAADLAELEIKVDTSQLKRAESEVRQLGERGERTQRSLHSMGRALQILGGAAGIGVATAAATRYMDAWTNAQNKLRLVSSTHAELQQNMERVYQIAQKSQSSIGATAGLYNKMSTAAERYGHSQEEAATMTQAFLRAMAAGGASAAEASSAVLQFSQALATGVLRGDEFNSVFEASPLLMKQLAQGMGVPIGQMRTLAAEGKLTADVLLKAIQKQSKAMNELHDNAENTADALQQNLNNALTRTAGAFKEATNATSIMTNATNGLIEVLDWAAANADLLLQAGETLAYLLAGRLVAAAGAWTKATVQSVIAQQRHRQAMAATTAEQERAAQGALRAAKAEADRARALARSAIADLRAQRAMRARVALQAQLARGTQHAAAANNALAGADAQLAAAENRASAAIRQRAAAAGQANAATAALNRTSNRAAAAAGRVGLLGNAVRGVLGFLGGPTGLVIMLGMAAASLVNFGNDAHNAMVDVDDLNDRLDRLLGKRQALRLDAFSEEIGRATKQIDLRRQKIADLQNKITDPNRAMSGISGPESEFFKQSMREIKQLRGEIDNLMQRKAEAQRAFNELKAAKAAGENATIVEGEVKRGPAVTPADPDGISEVSKAAEAYMERQERMIALSEKQTELARVNWEIEHGRFKGASKWHQMKLRHAAKMVDIHQKEQAALEEVDATAQKKLEAQKRKLQELSNAVVQGAERNRSVLESQVERVKRIYNEDLENYRAALAEGAISQAEYERLKVDNAKARAARIKQINESMAENESGTYEEMKRKYESFMDTLVRLTESDRERVARVHAERMAQLKTYRSNRLMTQKEYDKWEQELVKLREQAISDIEKREQEKRQRQLEEHAKARADAQKFLLGDKPMILGLGGGDGEVAPGVGTAIQALDGFSEKVEEEMTLGQSMVVDFANTFEQSIMTAARGGEMSFKKFAASALASLGQILLKAMVIQPILGAMGIPGFKDGAAFSGGKVTAFATGGVVDKPTLFPMQNGTGLMGEAGPEAIMPLKRGRNGKLGVQAEGEGNSGPNISIQIDARGAKGGEAENLRNASSEIAKLVREAVVRDFRRNGPMRRSLGA